MKKNFLMVAALLIAAMLMVVSCSQEVAPKNDGLVEARLNVAYGRELDVQHAADAEDLELKYTMVNQWTDQASNKIDKVYGAATDQPLLADGKLGWVSQGYWTVTVKAYKGSNVVFEGSTSIYFNEKNSNATVYLEPKQSATNSIEFNFYMQDLGKEYGTDKDFVVKYTITQNGTALTNHNSVAFDGEEVKQVYKAGSEVTTEATENAVYDHQRNYNKKITGLSSGYYTVTVSVYEKAIVDNKDKMTLKGGISKGFLLAGNNATVSGHVEPSDYVGTHLNTYYVDVETTLSEPTISYTTKEGKKTAATITLTLTDNTDVDKYNGNLTESTFTKSYLWSVNGAAFAAESADTPREKTVTVSKNGVNNITCRTIYSLTVPAAAEGEAATTYYWAETQDVSVQVTGIEY